MRFFFQTCPIFAIIPTIAFDDGACECGNPACPGGWTLFITFAGFEAGISVTRERQPPTP